MSRLKHSGPVTFRAAQHNRNFAGAHRDTDINGYQLLANAIVLQAVSDYRRAIKDGNTARQNALEKWFLGAWCGTLTKLDMAAVIEQIRGENIV